MQPNQNHSSQTQPPRNGGDLLLAVQGVDIRIDAEGRYCLNDLHRAAGAQAKDQPAFFMRRRETADLVTELSNPEDSRISLAQGASANSQTPVATLNDGRNNGTYVIKELVYAYAMWISASFHLKVIRAFDDVVTGRIAPAIDLNDPSFLRSTLLTYTEKVIALEAKVEQDAPKVEFHDRYAAAEGCKGVREVAKLLQAKQNEFIAFLISHGIMYRLNGVLAPIAHHLHAERFFVKAGVGANDHAFNQSMFTPRGITWIAAEWAKYTQAQAA